jgi:hypothetical protein
LVVLLFMMMLFMSTSGGGGIERGTIFGLEASGWGGGIQGGGGGDNGRGGGGGGADSPYATMPSGMVMVNLAVASATVSVVRATPSRLDLVVAARGRCSVSVSAGGLTPSVAPVAAATAAVDSNTAADPASARTLVPLSAASFSSSCVAMTCATCADLGFRV